MAMPESDSVTKLLVAMQTGTPGAEDAVLPLVYDHLHGLAANYMRRERPGHLLQATALVHEAYLQLVEQDRATWKSRAHFYGVAAQLMRRILVDHARREKAFKRGGGRRISLEEAGPLFVKRDIELDALDEALTNLAKLDERQARIVELRFFGGLDTADIAELLEVSTATVERDWRAARAWLYNQLRHRRG